MRGDLLHFVQRTLNRYINESSVAQDTLESLNGNSMCIEVKSFGLLISLTADDGQLVVAMPDSVDATVTIRGTVLNLFSLLGSTGAQALPKARVSLEGDAEVASGFWQLLRAARPDAEEELSRAVGDVLAHDIGKTVNSLDKYGRRVLSAFQMNATEYLQEEVKQLPPRVEIDGFFSSLERLRDDIERTGIRIKRLEAKLGQ
ncbi:MAG: SCP2 sterol-binding domain-containing protein [Pseudomonadota bacterium]|nr:SCP2 sterol-binding domain-containing protein [Pseudomonadota bacterium]